MKNWMLLGLLGVCTAANAGELADLHKKMVGSAGTTVESTFKLTRSERLKNQKLKITEIGLERGMCLGECPVYTVVIKSDGTFRYNGEYYVKKIGRHTGKIESRDFEALAEFINAMDYRHLANTYFSGIPDAPSVYTTVVTNSRRKVVENYGSVGPAKLWAIEQLIDKLLLEATWDDEKPQQHLPSPPILKSHTAGHGKLLN